MESKTYTKQQAKGGLLKTVYQDSFIISTVIFYLNVAFNIIKSFALLLLEVNNEKKKNTKDTTTTTTTNRIAKEEDELFPPHITIQDLKANNCQECSTASNVNFGSSLVPVKTEGGEIEWKFVDDNLPSVDFFDKQLAKIQQARSNIGQEFSPVSEASTTNDSNIEFLKLSHQNQSQSQSLKNNNNKKQLASPASTSEASPPLFQQQQAKQQSQLQQNLIDLSPQSSNKSQTSLESQEMEDGELDDDEDGEGEEQEIDPVTGKKKTHNCPHCSAKFRLRGYLTRHMKKHSSAKAYNCPFYNPDAENKCHATGGFSRRDTYKTHLKSRHFKYPTGVRSAKRIGMYGWCSLCGQSFANNEIWVEKHIESGECNGLPKGYQKRYSNKKKTGKRSHLLDAEWESSPSSVVPAVVPTPSNSTTSTTTTERQKSSSAAPTTTTTMYNSPLSSQAYSPVPSSTNTKQTKKEQQQQDGFEAFYYHPTQYQPMPMDNNTKSGVIDDDDDYAPLDDEFSYNMGNNNNARVNPIVGTGNGVAPVITRNDMTKFMAMKNLFQSSSNSNGNGIDFNTAFDQFRSRFPDFGF